ncbi:M50 family metallopeptidase [Bacillus velezensis]|nr:M50 family metallopeptidase [Bacillus velezensis]NRR26431.1 M50 family metallopeptidase [Bacillus velezensis]
MDNSQVKVQCCCDEELLVNPLYLNEDIELIIGANEEPMLYDRQYGKYIRLSKVSLEILDLMDGYNTGQDIINKLDDKYSMYANFPEIVYMFFSSLRTANVLNIKALPEHLIKRKVRRIANKPMLRLPLAKSLNNQTDTALQIYKTIPKKIQSILIYLLLLSAITSVIFLQITEGIQLNWTTVQWGWVAIIMILHLALHEIAHAIVTKAYGITIREAGIALLYYFIPVAYVDRTDTYRLKSKKGRIHIAIAGPYYDILASGMWAAVAMLDPQGPISDTAHSISTIQLCLVFSNLNLLLPTDGYHAVEAGVGEISLRKRAFLYFLHVITFRKLPAYLYNITIKRKLVYIIYSCVSLLYVTCLFGFLLFLII